jgi:hypothetical protein
LGDPGLVSLVAHHQLNQFIRSESCCEEHASDGLDARVGEENGQFVLDWLAESGIGFECDCDVSVCAERKEVQVVTIDT